MVGIPDGLGAFDNGDGTFTLLMNHELSTTAGVTRAHGSTGAFVSKWIINKSDLTVISGSDLIQTVYTWNTATSSYVQGTTAFGRFCSADLAPVTAFFNSATGLGTTERLFLNGEESGAEGRAFAHIATGSNAGVTYELPYLGKFSWENAVANPTAGNKTIVAGTDDSSTNGQVYFYVGTKTNTGTEIEKAGLTNGNLHGVKVVGLPSEDRNSLPTSGTRFDLYNLGTVQNMTGANLNTASVAAEITNFLRPEDGAWDPSNPNDFYFATTDRYDQVKDSTGTQVGRSRLWRLRFDDIANPEAGGTIEAVLDGTEAGNMFDNFTIDRYGHVLLQEDVGNQAHNGKIWQYDIATDTLKLLAQHDPARFGDLGVSATAPFNQDEESSGIIDAQDILGPGWFLFDTQAHYTITGELVEGGQLEALFNPDTYNAYLASTVDYNNTPITVTFNPGETYKDILIPIAGDITPEANETVNLSLVNPSTGTVVGTQNPNAILNLSNDDGVFQLQILHYYGESGILGTTTAPIMGALIDKFDDQYANTLVLGEGDSFIPGPWLVAGADPSLNSVAGIGSTALGRPDIAIMNAFGTDASALGNHEFDLGSPVLQSAINASGAWVGAQFPFITTNLDFSADSSLRALADTSLGGTGTFAGKEANTIKGKIAPYTVVTQGGEKIGIVGATTYDLLTKTSPNGTVPKDDGNPSTDDLQEVAAYIQSAVNALTALGVNKIVMVDQLDTIERNKLLAPLVSGIDIMVAGGGHERMGDATDTAVAFNGHSADFVADAYPIVTAGADGKTTLIVTTDTEYTYLGRLVINFDANGELIVSDLSPAINGAYAATEANLQAAYGTTNTASQIIASSTIGSNVKAITNAIDSVITAKDGTVWGYTNVYLEGDRAFGRAQEVNLGDITADANLYAAQQVLGGRFIASLKNGGGIRASIGSIDEDGSKIAPIANPTVGKQVGGISTLDIENALRFNNKLMVFDTTPQGLKNILEYAAGLAPGNGGYMQIGGIRVSYNPANASGSKVQSIALTDLAGKITGIVYQNGAIVPDAPATINMVIINFTANGGDGYPIKANGENFRYLLTDGTLSSPIDESLDFTASANVPANALGEQKALETYLQAFYGSPATAYNVADTPATLDERIQNLNSRQDTVISIAPQFQRSATGQGAFWDQQQWLTGDFNGDGFDDTAKTFNDNGLASVDVHPSNGSSFAMQRWATQQGGFWDQQQWLTGDFNGDGKDDVAKAFNDNGLASVDVHLSNGSSFAIQRWATGQGAFWDQQQWLVGDFNGDGFDDVAKAFNDNGLASIDVHLSNGSNGFTIQRWGTGQGAFWDQQQWIVGDFNGDGKDDLLKAFNDNGLASVDVHLSNGASFTIQRWATGQGGFWDQQQWLVEDFNGDGKDDVAKAFGDNGLASVDVHYSSGSSFAISRWSTQQGAFWDQQQWFAGDFNGNQLGEVGKACGDNGLASIDVQLS
jgi:2',3'-cyclic-nucleotide 2'-phosphodiesterase (5'-nucleotidase family)